MKRLHEKAKFMLATKRWAGVLLQEDEEEEEWGGDGGRGLEAAKRLPLSLAVQAALGVLALPKEECNMLQPSQAKLN